MGINFRHPGGAKIKDKFINSLKDRFVKNSLIFAISSLMVSFLNYFFQLLMGRVLTLSQFGNLQYVISIITQIAIFSVALNTGIIHLKLIKSTVSEEKLIQDFTKTIVGLTLVITVILFIFNLTDRSSFSVILVWFLILGISLSSINYTNRLSRLQALEKFTEASIANLLVATSKIFISISLALTFLKETGAILGILTAQMAGNYYLEYKTRVRLGQIYLPEKEKRTEEEKEIINKELRELIPIIVFIFSVTLMYTLDLVLVRRYFSLENAGIYAGASVIAKILIFISLPVATVLLPALRNSKEKTNSIIMKSVSLTAVLTMPLGIFLFTLPKFSMLLLMGSKYAGSIEILPTLTLAMIFISFANLFGYTLISLKRTAWLYLSVGGPLTLLFITVTNHQSLQQVTLNLIISSLVLIIPLIFGLLRKVSKDE